MSETKHTPGQWSYGKLVNDADQWDISDESGLTIGLSYHGKPNARLMAAAPELLAACKSLTSAKTGRKVCKALNCFLGLDDDEPTKWTHSNVCKWVRAAISAAEGDDK